MQCPHCQTENLGDSLFCTECGARMETACPACGAGNPPGAKSYAPLICAKKAELARLLGDGNTRERELREAHRLFSEMAATGHTERLTRELASLGAGAGGQGPAGKSP